MDVELESRPGGRRSGARRKVPRQGRFRAEVGFVALALALLVSGLGFGAQHTQVLLVAAALSVSAACLSPRGVPLSKLALGLLALCGFTALQAIPLPFVLVKAVSPAAADVWDGALRPFHQGPPAWVSLSIDPFATWLETLKYASYACLAVAAAGIRARRGSPAIAALVFGASLAVCAVTLAHGIVLAPRIYGIFTPIDLAERWTRGPFVNANNLAAYLNVGLLAGAGLWIGGRSPFPPAAYAAGVPLLAVGVLLGGSRGGVLSLVVAAGLVVAIAISRKILTIGRAAVGAAAVAVLGVFSLFVLGDSRLRQSLFETDVSAKWAGFHWTFPMLGDFPVFGVGRGAFEGGFQPYRGVRGNSSTIYVHAENLVLDWVSEWGFAVGLAALAGLGALLVSLVSRARKDLTLAGLSGAVVAVVLGGLVDFGLEIFGIAALVVVVLSTAETNGKAPPSARLWLRFVPAGVAALSLAIVLALGADTARADRKRVRNHPALASGASKASAEELRTELRAQMLRHPGDGYFPLVGAHLAAREGKNALPWLGRAIERTPRSGAAHLALGEALARLKQKSQALIHLRLAAIYDYSLSDPALRRAVELEPDVQALARAFPHDVTGGSLFVDLCPRVRVENRVACYREALRRDASNRKLQAEFALELLDALEAKRAPCTGEEAKVCEADAARTSQLLVTGGGYRQLEISARILARRGELLEAVTNLLAGCPATPGAAGCLELAVELASRLKDKELSARASERFIALACEVSARCASAHTFVADKLEAAGDLMGAMEHLKAAAREAPTTSRWLKVADMAARSGQPSAQRSAVREAKALGAVEGHQKRELERLEREGPIGLPR
jgi:hypothetical protein